MNKVYVLTQVEDNGEILTTHVFSSKDSAVDYAMQQLFGEDWELQLDDDDWENQPELLDAMGAFDSEYAYLDSDGAYWYLTGNEVE